jgi:hypothetical protein
MKKEKEEQINFFIFNLGYIPNSEIDENFNKIEFDENDEYPPLIREFIRISMEVEPVENFSEKEIDSLLPIINFFWDYQPTTEGDDGRKIAITLVHEISKKTGMEKYFDEKCYHNLVILKSRDLTQSGQEGKSVDMTPIYSIVKKRIRIIMNMILNGNPN